MQKDAMIRIYHELYTNFSKSSIDSVRKVLWNLRSSDDRAFDRQSKGPGVDTQRSGSVPFFTEKIV